jgi:hypothetical protein
LAGETTVISAAQIACFLTASGFADVVPTGAANATQCRADE